MGEQEMLNFHLIKVALDTIWCVYLLLSLFVIIILLC